MVAIFCKMIPTMKSVPSSEIYKILGFDQNYDFTLFQKIRIFPGFTKELRERLPAVDYQRLLVGLASLGGWRDSCSCFVSIPSVTEKPVYL